MSVRRPPHEQWHDALPAECVCRADWRKRGFVDDGCSYHRMIEIVEWLREELWLVEPPRPKDAS